MTIPNNQGSGAAGKPGEPTARNGAGEPAAEAKITYSSEGMASLLKKAFAEDDPQSDPGNGDQPGAGAEGRNSDDKNGHPADDGQPAGAEGGESNANGEGEGQGEGQAGEGEGAGGDGEGQQPGEGAGAAGAQLPVELQNALETWEREGGGELPPVLQALVAKRIGKITDQRETEKGLREAAETKVRELEAEVTQLRATGGEPQSIGIMGVPDEKTLRQDEQVLQKFVDEAQAYLDDAATDSERTNIEKYMEGQGLDAPKLRRQVREAERALRAIPAKRQQLTEYRKIEAGVEPEVKKYFPWMDNKTDPNYQKAQEVLKSIPDLRARTASHRLVLGIYVLGWNEFEKLRGKNGPAAPAPARPKPKPPVKVPAGGSAAPAAARGTPDAAAEATRQKFAKAPTRANAVEMAKMDLLRS